MKEFLLSQCKPCFAKTHPRTAHVALDRARTAGASASRTAHEKLQI
jgi:hypothetical protein